jgi:hypothetical protein
MSTSFYKQVISIHAVPLPLILATAAISVGLVTTFWLGWAIWQVAILVILAWVPLFFLKTAAIQRHYGWLAFFFILVVTQGAHLLEHVAQMVQIHLLGLSGLQARGIFGMLDIEWVHFIWNSGLLARGGALGGGLPLSRPDLHFFYNLLEELVLIIAYLYQIRRLPIAEEILPPPRSPFVAGT